MSFNIGFSKTAIGLDTVGSLASGLIAKGAKALGRKVVKDPLGFASKAMTGIGVAGETKGNYDKLQDYSQRG